MQTLQLFEEEKCTICGGFSLFILFDPSCESLEDALKNLSEVEAVRAGVQALKYVTSLQLMFNEASRQPVLIPLDISVRPSSSTRSLTLSLKSSEFDKPKADLMSEFNNVMLHQLLQVIKKSPANEAVTFNFSALKHAVAYNLFSTYSDMFCFIHMH